MESRNGELNYSLSSPITACGWLTEISLHHRILLVEWPKFDRDHGYDQQSFSP